MKKIFLPLFLAICNFHFISAQDWVHNSTAITEENYIQIFDIDRYNNVYCKVLYSDTVIFSDTSFRHQKNGVSRNIAIPIYRQDGTFIKALDIYSESGNSQGNSYLVVDEELNIYIAGAFSDTLYIQDTSISVSENSIPETDDIFLLKINKDNKVEWVQLISSEYLDEINGLLISNDGFLYLSVKHHLEGDVNYFNQDTVAFENSPSVVLKVNRTGKLLWRKALSGIIDKVNPWEFQISANGNVLFFGTSEGDVRFENDTLINPYASTYYPDDFLIELKPDGEIESYHFSGSTIGLLSVVPAPDGDLFFSGLLSVDTTYFGGDTLITTPYTSVRLIGRMANDFTPIWYEQMRSVVPSTIGMFKIDYRDDSLYGAVTGQRNHKLAGIEYDLGTYPSTLLTSFHKDGASSAGVILEAQYLFVPANIMLDHCNNLLIGGAFRGIGQFEKDTIQSTSDIISDGFISKYLRGSFIMINLGNDTTIGLTESISIVGPAGYDYYKWSTNDTTQKIEILGELLGTGHHPIWCEATLGDCIISDTVIVIVIDDNSINEINFLDFKVYPNPFTTSTTIEYHLNQPSDITLSIFNHFGEQVDLIRQNQQQGKQQVIWNAEGLPPGMYYFTLKAGEQVATGKMVLMK